MITRAILLVFEKFTRAYLFQIALEIMWLPIQNKWIYVILKVCIIEYIRFLPLFCSFPFIHLLSNQNFFVLWGAKKKTIRLPQLPTDLAMMLLKIMWRNNFYFIMS